MEKLGSEWLSRFDHSLFRCSQGLVQGLAYLKPSVDTCPIKKGFANANRVLF